MKSRMSFRLSVLVEKLELVAPVVEQIRSALRIFVSVPDWFR
jgi:hypothetical protein